MIEMTIGETVVSKLDNKKAIISKIVDANYMYVRYEKKFVKGGYSSFGEMALIKNFKEMAQ